MKTKWRVHRTRSVARYLIGLRDAGQGIRQMIDLLAQYGVPSNADKAKKDEKDPIQAYTWMAAGHTITCLVAEEEQAIYVSEVEPIDVRPVEVKPKK